MQETTKVFIDNKCIVASVDEFFCANNLRVTVGTNCPQGGDSGHGGRTVLILEDTAGTDLRCSMDSTSASYTQRIEIVLGGDSECDTFIQALEFAARTLKLLQQAQATNTGQKEWCE
jgi:hypothetical protein